MVIGNVIADIVCTIFVEQSRLSSGTSSEKRNKGLCIMGQIIHPSPLGKSMLKDMEARTAIVHTSHFQLLRNLKLEFITGQILWGNKS
jgi:hypothetical protein